MQEEQLGFQFAIADLSYLVARVRPVLGFLYQQE